MLCKLEAVKIYSMQYQKVVYYAADFDVDAA